MISQFLRILAEECVRQLTFKVLLPGVVVEHWKHWASCSLKPGFTSLIGYLHTGSSVLLSPQHPSQNIASSLVYAELSLAQLMSILRGG